MGIRRIFAFAAVIAAICLSPTMAWASTGGGASSDWTSVGFVALGVAATIAGAARAEDEEDARAEDEPSDAPDAEDEPMGDEPNGICKSCNSQNEENAKFCDQCGSSMAALRADDDEPPPSSKKPGAAVTAPKRVSAEGSVAGILGATSDSIPAVKARAIDLRHVADTAAAVFATTSPGEIVGHLLGLPERLAAGDKAIKDHAQAKAKGEKNERWSLAKRLNALNLAGRSRSTIFEDKVDAKGNRAAVGLQPEYARMDLDVFRGLVTSLEKSAPKARKDPFAVSEERARKAAESAAAASGKGPSRSGDITEADIAWAKQQPSFLRMSEGRPLADHDKIARGLVMSARKMGGVL